MAAGTFQCPSCRAPCSPAELFAHCTVSWPNQRWLLFECPGCGTSSHVEVADGRAALGELDGAPGPAFFATQSVSIPGLRVGTSSRGVALSLNGTRTVVPAKR